MGGQEKRQLLRTDPIYIKNSRRWSPENQIILFKKWSIELKKDFQLRNIEWLRSTWNSVQHP
jgi:hypothetical protein